MEKIICFGEVLWDMLPSGKIPGGAPMNVAFHLNQFGWTPQMISKVGNDSLGKELLDFLRSKNISTSLIQIDPAVETGTVQVELDELGFPSYEISDQVAYDFLDFDETLEKAVLDTDVIIFGTLAVRHEKSRKTLLRLIECSKYRVFDVNLRVPFFDKPGVEFLLEKADLVKMNDEELNIFADWFSLGKEEHEQLKELYQRFGLKGIIVTKGAEGAGYYDGEVYLEEPGIAIKVQDTIGSGDSFLAGFLSQHLRGKPSEECLKFACKIGALVASKKGGTPGLTKEEIDGEVV